MPFLENFLTSCGRLFFLKMRPAFFFTLLTFPIGLSLFFLFQQIQSAKDLENRFQIAARKEQAAFLKKNQKEELIAQHSHANPYFLDHEIESMKFLEKEKKQLLFLLNSPAFPDLETLRSRLDLIEENMLSFREEKMQSGQGIKEVIEKQIHPVEMDEEDLKRTLFRIENTAAELNAPQLIIRDFQLKKKELPTQSEVFEVEMELIKREFSD